MKAAGAFTVLGIAWAVSILIELAVATVPNIPFIFACNQCISIWRKASTDKARSFSLQSIDNLPCVGLKNYDMSGSHSTGESL